MAQPEGPVPHRAAAGGDTPAAAGPCAGLPPLRVSRRAAAGGVYVCMWGDAHPLPRARPGQSAGGCKAERFYPTWSSVPEWTEQLRTPPGKAQRWALGEALGRTAV